MSFLLDATLREGAQSPTARLTRRRRLAILRGLAAIGVAEAEIGCAARDADLPSLVAAARRAAPGLRLSVWCRGLPADIALGSACAADVVHVSLPASDLHLERRLGKDRVWLLKRISESALAAQRSGARSFALGLEDATRADPVLIASACRMARDAGYCRVRLADTVSAVGPSQMIELVSLARSEFRGPVGVHCHDDFGLATGNAVAALEAGAAWADGCLLGAGERAGTARTEALAAWLAVRCGHAFRLDGLPGLCRIAATALGRRLDPHAPVVGDAIWRVASGLHVDGLAKDSRTYEPFDPATVGAKRELLLGPGSGRAAVRQACQACGLEVSDDELERLVGAVRRSGLQQLHDLPGLLGALRHPCSAAER
jgi:homocitrate synthase NifV